MTFKELQNLIASDIYRYYGRFSFVLLLKECFWGIGTRFTIWLRLSGYLKQKGYDIKVLNFAKPEISTCYNPLERANTLSDIQKVSSLLIENAMGGKTKDPFWNTQAVALLSMLINILKKQDKSFQNLHFPLLLHS